MASKNLANKKLYISVMLTMSANRRKLVNHFGFKRHQLSRIKLHELDDATINTFYKFLKSKEQF